MSAHILALMSIGQLSLDLRAAELAADSAKHDYHAAWRKFECGDDGPEECGQYEHRIVQGHMKWFQALYATAAEYAAYQTAKRAAYNVKRRWMNACRRAA